MPFFEYSLPKLIPLSKLKFILIKTNELTNMNADRGQLQPTISSIVRKRTVVVSESFTFLNVFFGQCCFTGY